MDFSNIDNVKVEKEKAMMRYHRLQNIAKMWRLLEVCVALAAISWWSTRFPTALRLPFPAESLFHLSLTLRSTHFVFFIGNAIVLALYLLSRQNHGGNNGDAGGATDLYEEYVQSSEIRRTTTTVCDGEAPPETAEEAVVENGVAKLQCEAVEAAIREAAKEIRRFQRSQSVKLNVKPPRELRRSETHTDRRMVISDERRSVSSLEEVESLSNEEFRRTIDEYIAKHQRSLWTQKVADQTQILYKPTLKP